MNFSQGFKDGRKPHSCHSVTESTCHVVVRTTLVILDLASVKLSDRLSAYGLTYSQDLERTATVKLELHPLVHQHGFDDSISCQTLSVADHASTRFQAVMVKHS